jgi:hypothetical protein
VRIERKGIVAARLDGRGSAVTKSKSARQRQRLIDEMFQQPTLAKAAEAAGISLTTAWRIRQTREFELEYRLASQQAHGQALGRTQYWSGSAVSVLLRAMTDAEAPWSSRVKAAREIMVLAQRAAELATGAPWDEQPAETTGIDLSCLTEEQLFAARQMAFAVKTGKK